MAGYRKYSCKYPGCTSGYVPNKGHANKHFFTFPKNPKLHELWRNACKIEDPVVQNFGVYVRIILKVAILLMRGRIN
ncbi:hypothetical protein TcasGA2_TC006961 [Tribolium castaneum]|uniref:THAP-type domain-containing protein n=1 Tax=Tribolium castaneum TaxID=7070 RepID=D7GY24_TRICA|nr:hypothetical protein TcasGA2_TC006961 [Tribolium castaneum]